MKTLLEITQKENGRILFNTDLDLTKNPSLLFQLSFDLAFAMMTNLWGGNESSVIGIIRSLAIADLSICGNRKDIVRFFDEASKDLCDGVHNAVREMEQKGLVKTFPPNVKPSNTAS